MKNFNKFFFIFLFLFSFLILKNAVAVEKTAFINVDFLFKNSNVGKKTFKNIEDLNKQNISILEKKNKQLLKLEDSINNKKNVISEADFNNEVKNFKEKVKIFTDEKNTIVKEYNNYRETELKKLFNLFNPIITKYMEENNLGILLESKNIFMGKAEMNITEDILKIINSELK